MTAGRGVASQAVGFAVIGEGGQTPRPADAHPCPTPLEIASGHNLRRVRPFPQSSGRAGIEFVAVGGDDHGKRGVDTVGEYDQAHNDFWFDLGEKAMVA